MSQLQLPLQTLLTGLSLRCDPREDKGRVPRPSHRYASPSDPWPWIDLEDGFDRVQLESGPAPIPVLCNHRSCGGCYVGYPQSRFPDWSQRQVEKSRIFEAIHNYDRDKTCILHRVDVDNNGFFTNPGEITARPGHDVHIWEALIYEERPEDIRVRTMFIENMSGPILQMLGTKFNIVPFFWSSSLSWTPSRFQEKFQPGIGDHISITLTFLRSMSDHDTPQLKSAPHTLLGTQTIDPHKPLTLHSNMHILVLDILSVYLIRNKNGSTIISFHPSLNLPTTTASFLHERICIAGQSVHWQNIFQKSSDPTLVLLFFFWHAMHAWDEALENLYDHICSLETRVINTAEINLSRELHVIRAYQLHYSSLLDDFHKHVLFIRDTRNPAMGAATAEDHRYSKSEAMYRECENLLTEVNAVIHITR